MSELKTGVDNCKICNNEFYVKKMINGKCQLCHARFPNANSMEDVKKQQQEQYKENEGSFENRVVKLVNQTLENLGIIVKCECGKLYYKRSPAQKSCGCGGEKKEIENVN